MSLLWYVTVLYNLWFLSIEPVDSGASFSFMIFINCDIIALIFDSRSDFIMKSSDEDFKSLVKGDARFLTNFLFDAKCTLQNECKEIFIRLFSSNALHPSPGQLKRVCCSEVKEPPVEWKGTSHSLSKWSFYASLLTLFTRTNVVMNFNAGHEIHAVLFRFGFCLNEKNHFGSELGQFDDSHENCSEIKGLKILSGLAVFPIMTQQSALSLSIHDFR